MFRLDGLFEQSLVLFSFQKKSSFPLYSTRVDSLQRCYTIPLEASGSASRVSNGCFCQWDDPCIGTSDLFRRPAWNPLFRGLVNVTLSPTPSRTMPPHVPGCGRATHSSLVPRTLPRPSPWLSLRGNRVVLISIAWYVRVGCTEGESAVRKCRGGELSWAGVSLAWLTLRRRENTCVRVKANLTRKERLCFILYFSSRVQSFCSFFFSQCTRSWQACDVQSRDIRVACVFYFVTKW